jgi:acetoin utilization protein AcuB
MRVDALMVRDVHAVEADVDAEAAWHHMRRAGVRHLVVLGDDDQVVGILSQRDFALRDAGSLARFKVRELMTPRAIVAPPELELREAAKLMHDHVIGCLPIVDGARLVGIITTTDLLAVLAGEPRPEPDPDTVRPTGRVLRK